MEVFPPHLRKETVCYVAPWNRELELLFLEAMAMEVREGNYVVGASQVLNRETLHAGAEYIARKTGQELTVAYLFNKIARLKERYDIFTYILRDPEVIYYDQMGMVRFATESAWQRIVRGNPHALMYEIEGEPYFKLMKMLFERPRVRRTGRRHTGSSSLADNM